MLDFGIAAIPSISVVSYLLGLAIKASPLDDKFIPLAVGCLGGILGIVGMFTIPGFPANDYIGAIAVGIVSGLASTGINELAKQMRKVT